MKVDDINAILNEVIDKSEFKADVFLGSNSDYINIRIYYYKTKKYQLIAISGHALYMGKSNLINQIIQNIEIVCRNLINETLYLSTFDFLMDQIMYSQYTPGKLY